MPEVTAAAADRLIASGYAGFHMADLADDLGVTEAAVYRYVEGKDALVHTAFYDCLYPGRSFDGKKPIADPGRAEMVALVDEFLRETSPLPELQRLLRAPSAPKDGERELADFVRVLYRSLAEHRHALQLIERVALEWPELEKVWYRGVRPEFLKTLNQFLTRRSKQGVLRILDPETTGAILVELVFHYAVTRHYGRFPVPVDPAQLEDAIVAMSVRGLVADSGSMPPRTAARRRPKPDRGARRSARPRR